MTKRFPTPHLAAILIGLCALAIADSLLAQSLASAPASTPRSAALIDWLEIKSRSDAFGGKSFGKVGVYETIVAVAHGKLDPTAPANSAIVDLASAPRSNGYVDYQTDVVILRPKSATNARRVLLYDVVNRGNKRVMSFNYGTPDLTSAAGAGDGLMMREGYTLVWSGWQGDIEMSGDGSRIGAAFPVAKGSGGAAITGKSRDEFVFDNATNPINAALSYPAADRNPANTILRVKNRQADPWTTVTTWSWVDDSTIRINRPTTSDAGAIYEFIYTAKDPMVLGIGFAGVRDLISFLRNETADGRGNPNPLADLRSAPCEVRNAAGACAANSSTTFDVAIIDGFSQSGRMVRDFIWQGFNADVRGRKVFEGALPLISGSRKMWTNERFGQPGRWSKQHEDHFQLGDQFPFTYATTMDPITGKRDGILAKCSTSDTCPRIVHIDSGVEFWQARSALITTDATGRDLALPANVRAFYMSGAPHGFTGGSYTGTIPSTTAACKLPNSIVNTTFVPRALTIALVDWIARGVEPPASRWPAVAAGTLVDPRNQARVGFPDLSKVGLRYTGSTYNALALVDYSVVPPVANASKMYPSLVPTTDQDGNDLGGVRSPDLTVPLGTNLPWNPRKAGFGEDDGCAGQGSFIPFAPSSQARAASGDPRRSLVERYSSKADYVNKVVAAAQALVKDRLMLAEDVAWWKERAEAVQVLH